MDEGINIRLADPCHFLATPLQNTSLRALFNSTDQSASDSGSAEAFDSAFVIALEGVPSTHRGLASPRAGCRRSGKPANRRIVGD